MPCEKPKEGDEGMLWERPKAGRARGEAQKVARSRKWPNERPGA